MPLFYPTTTNLHHESVTHILEERRLQIIKRLVYREKMRRAYKKIGDIIKPRINTGLSRVDIPDSPLSTPDNFPDAKTWQGPWLTITNPEDIARVVSKMNTAQYHQAHQTPFGSGIIGKTIGRRADTQAAADLLAGNCLTLPNLLPETKRILDLPGTSALIPINLKTIITEEEFIAAYKVVKEATSSSPSGRHIGHYKAILSHPTIVNIHHIMMSLPFTQGFAPIRWGRVVDVMVQNEEGNSRCHRLRIIALFENDLNQAKRILLGRKLLHHLEKHKLIGPMQYGSRPGKKCQSAVLQKVLSHDITRLTRNPAAFIENDAIGCYNRLANSFVLLISLKLGVPSSITNFFGALWDTTTHNIKTQYGVSSVGYHSTSTTPLYGPGQGCTCGPLFWLLCWLVIFLSIDPSLARASFTSVCRTSTKPLVGTSFVDDSSLAVMSTYDWDPGLTNVENNKQELELLITDIRKLGTGNVYYTQQGELFISKKVCGIFFHGLGKEVNPS
jgi:hypothetical protein